MDVSAKRAMRVRLWREEITSHDLTMSLRGLLNDNDESIATRLHFFLVCVSYLRFRGPSPPFNAFSCTWLHQVIDTTTS